MPINWIVWYDSTLFIYVCVVDIVFPFYCYTPLLILLNFENNVLYDIKKMKNKGFFFFFYKSKHPPSPNLLLFPIICYEHLVHHCSLGNDLGSHPSYYILMFIWFGHGLDQIWRRCWGVVGHRFILASDLCFMFSCFTLTSFV